MEGCSQGPPPSERSRRTGSGRTGTHAARCAVADRLPTAELFLPDPDEVEQRLKKLFSGTLDDLARARGLGGIKLVGQLVDQLG